jgi:hypothetical protein
MNLFTSAKLLILMMAVSSGNTTTELSNGKNKSNLYLSVFQDIELYVILFLFIRLINNAGGQNMELHFG